MALLPCLLTRPNLHKRRVTNLIALSLWRRVEKSARNEMKIEVVLRPNLTLAIELLKNRSRNDINIIYNSTVKKEQMFSVGISK